MTLLRMLAFRPEALTAGEKAAPSKSGSEAAPVRRTKPAAKPQSDEQAFWPNLVRQLQVTGAARELARNAELARHEGGVFELVVPKSKSYLAEKPYQEKLKTALEQHLGTRATVKVRVGETKGLSTAAIEAGEREIRQTEATRAVQADPFVQDLVKLCDAKVIDSSIRATPKDQ